MINLFKTIGAALLILSATACVTRTPTETVKTVDDRPVITFNFEGAAPTSEVKIFIDNLYMGDATQLRKSKQGLKVIAGTHMLKLEYQGNTLIEKKIYLGAGTQKVISVNTQTVAK